MSYVNCVKLFSWSVLFYVTRLFINMTFIWLDDISSSELGYGKCLM